jgi:hypothetical protein
MKIFTRLGALGRHFRGWLPMGSAAVAGALALNSRRRVFITAAGAFFVAVGVFVLPLVIPWYYVIDGPLAQFLCPPRTPCLPFALDVSLIAPVFLMVLGELLVGLGLRFRSERHRRSIKMTAAAGGVFSAIVGASLLTYVPNIPSYTYICNSTVCVANMTPITPFFLIVFGAGVIMFGVLYRRGQGVR